MNYKLMKWKIRNMGVISVIKCFFSYKPRIIINEQNLIHYKKMDTNSLEDYKMVMIVKSNGLTYKEYLLKILKKNNINDINVFDVPDYNSLMIYLFPTISSFELTAWKHLNTKYYTKGNEPSNAYIFLFNTTMQFKELEIIKRKMRRKIGVKTFRISVVNADKEVTQFKTTITPLHIPGRKKMEHDYNIVKEYIKKYKLRGNLE